MNARIKKRWVKALRSGEYKQTFGTLRYVDDFDEDLRVSYCCLGVLCDLFVKSKAGKAINAHWGDGVEILGRDNYLPDEVQAWAGLGEEDPVLGPKPKKDSDGYRRVSLGDLNDDNKYSFRRIATLIEKKL